MGAIWYRARAELRERWRATAGMALVVAVVGGIVVASAAGARRTTGAYERFLAETNAAHGAIINGGSFFGFASVDFELVAAMPEVAEVSPVRFLPAMIRTPSGDLLTPIPDRNPVVALFSPDGVFGAHLNRRVARLGRLPDPARADEVAVGHIMAEAYGLGVGDRLQIYTAPIHDTFAIVRGERPLPPPSEVTVTGVAVAAGDLPPGVGYPTLYLPDGFGPKIAPEDAFDALIVRLHRDASEGGFLDRVKREAVLGGTGSEPQWLSFADNARAVRAIANVNAVILWVLAALLGAGAALVVSQAVVRHAFLDARDDVVLGALGFSTRQRFAASALRLVVPFVSGTIGAFALAVGLSPVAPIGVTRLAEMSPGFAVDGIAVGVGSAAIVVLGLAASLGAAWRATRAGSARRLLDGTERIGRAGDVAARAGLPAVPVIGVRMALETGRGRSAVPVRSTLAGTAAGVAALVAALLFAASLQRVVETPRLQGWAWDAVVGDDFDPDSAARVLPLLTADARIADVSAGGAGGVSIEGRSVSALGMDEVKGRIEPVLIEGRAPIRDDEIALASRTMRDVGARVGTTVEVVAGARERRMRVVGRIVAPAIAQEAFAGRGAWMSFDAMLVLLPDNPRNLFLFAVAPGADRAAVAGDLKAALPELGVASEPTEGELIGNVHIRRLPIALSGVLAALAAATLAHMLVTGVRRKRGELAVLKALGFDRGQVRSAIAWQAATLAVVSVAIGIPLGVMFGRWGWGMLVRQVGIPFEPSVPALQLLTIVPAAVVIALAIALSPARAAARTQPAAVLRIE